MMSKRPLAADLHLHSTFSDGDLVPAELLRFYRERAYLGIALTDHDSVAGVLPLLEEARQTAGAPVVVPGLELTLCIVHPSCTGSLHLLLYFRPELLAYPRFQADLAELFESGRGVSLLRRRIAALNAHLPGGMEPLTEEDFDTDRQRVTRRTLLKALMGKGLTEPAGRSLLANDSPAYIPSGAPLENARRVLDRYGFLKVLAHPAAGSNPADTPYREVYPPFATLRRIAREIHGEIALDGLELRHPGHTPELSRGVRRFARSLSLDLFSGGSDCHDWQLRPPGAEGLDRRQWEHFAARLAGLTAHPA